MYNTSMFKDRRALVDSKSDLYRYAYYAGIFFSAVILYGLTRSSAVDYYAFYQISRNIIYLGQDLYGPNPAFSYPPFFFCIISFFSQFTLKVSFAFWMLFNSFVIVYSFIVTMRIIRHFEPANRMLVAEKKQRSGAKVIIPFMVLLGIAADNLYLGQINPLVFLFCLLAIYGVLKKKYVYAGIFLGLAISIKLTPALLAVFLIFKGEKKFLPWCLLTILLCFTAVPSLFLGVQNTIKFTSDFFGMVILPFFRGDLYIRETSGFWNTNQSFDGFFARHFTPFGAQYYKMLGLHRFDPAFLTLEQAKKLSMLFKIITLAVTAYALRGRLGSNPRLFKFEISAVFLLILLISPASWINHYITVIFVYYTVINYITNIKNNPDSRKMLAGSLLICSILTATGAFALSHDLQAALQSMSGMFLGHLMLFSALIAFLIREKKGATNG
ncbi:MAG: glycosyltransferase family 87 protein [Candidatus Firestonebacteria bacterium]